MGPKDPSQLSLAAIQSVLNPNMSSEYLPGMGITLTGFLDKGVDNLERLTRWSTQFKLYEAVDTYLINREKEGGQATALDVLHYLKHRISFALLSPIGRLFGADTVEPNSTNPFRTAVASVTNAELRRIYQELHLDSLDTPGEGLLRAIMDDPSNSIRADHRQQFEAVKLGVASTRP